MKGPGSLMEELIALDPRVAAKVRVVFEANKGVIEAQAIYIRVLEERLLAGSGLSSHA
jgi:hypothetical protein